MSSSVIKPGYGRIHKVLAEAGLGSRRQLEEWIRQGKVKVNGRIAGIGDSIDINDRVSLFGKAVRLKQKLPAKRRVIACYKPAGLICTRKDPEGRKTVFSLLPPPGKGRWVTVGRLDINTTGLLLFSNDGELAHSLMHPSRQIEREYAVRTLGTATAAQLEALTKEVLLDGVPARFDSVVDAGGQGANHWYHVVIREGRNREVRRLWELQGLKVSRLIRVRYGPYKLPGNKRPGEVWELTETEVNQLIINVKS